MKANTPSYLIHCEQLFDGKELEISEVFKIISKEINPTNGIIKHLWRATGYHDYPRLIQYGAELNDISSYSDIGNVKLHAAGTSFIHNKALIKTIGEAIERYCLAMYQKKNLLFGSYREIKNRPFVLNPKDVSLFSQQQILENSFLRKNATINNDSKFYWIRALDLHKNREILIPAQLVYVPYFYDNEPILRSVINSGAAAGTSYNGATLRAIYEVIEIDAFIIYYFNRLHPPKVDIRKFPNLRCIKESFERYSFRVDIFDITTEINIPVYLVLLIDLTKHAPPLSVGIKANLNPMEAIEGALEEAFHTLPWTRALAFKGVKQKREIRYFEDRAIYWLDHKKLNYLSFFLDSSKYTKPRLNESKNNIENLKNILKILKRNNINIFLVDITTPKVRNLNFKTVKAVIPGFYSLYIDERFKATGGKRLYEVPLKLKLRKNFLPENQLNPIPHPML